MKYLMAAFMQKTPLCTIKRSDYWGEVTGTSAIFAYFHWLAAVKFFPNVFFFLPDTLILYFFFLIIEINICLGDLSDVWATTATLMSGCCSHKKKRMKQIQKMAMRGLLDAEKEDPFSLFVASTNIRYCYYNETQNILGNTFGMCVLQVRHPVLLFTKWNKMFFGYFDPDNIFLDHENK